MVLPPLGNSDHVAVSVSIDFFSNSKVDVPFHCKAYDYSCADWDNVCDYLRDVLWEKIFNLWFWKNLSWFLQYVPQRIFFSILSEGLISDSCVYLCWIEVYHWKLPSCWSSFCFRRVFEKLVNNRLVDHLQKCGL